MPARRKYISLPVKGNKNYQLMIKICKNCGQIVEGNYCSNCSQSADTARFKTKSFFDDLAYGITNSNRGILYTLRGLFTRPGYMMAEYLAGKRVLHFRPMPMLVILAGLYGLLNHFCEINILDANVNPDVEELKTIAKTYSNPIIKTIVDWVKSTTFTTIIMLPMYALASMAIFRKTVPVRYNFAEYLFMGAYMACQRLIIFIVLVPYEYFDNRYDDMPISHKFLTVLIFLGLAAWDFKQFFGLKTMKAIRKTVNMFLLAWASAIVALIILAILAITIIVLITGNDYGAKDALGI